MVPTSRFEPQTLAAGDSIRFEKQLPDFPSAAWSLVYEVAGEITYEFTSAASGAGHLVTVDAATTAAWAAGTYELTGFAVNATTGERKQIYQAPFVVEPNVAAGDRPATTLAQRMLALIETVLEGKAAHDILESDVEGTRIKRMSPAELRTEHAYWKNIRDSEIDGERARAGLPSRNKIKPRFQITHSGSVMSPWPPFSS